MNRKLKVIGLIGVTLLVIGGIILAIVLAGSDDSTSLQPGATFPPAPEIELTPPFSLADLADQYPALAHLLINSELASVFKEFLIAWQQGGQADAVELARQRGLLDEQERLRLTLILDSDDSDALAVQLEDVGVEVIAAYRDQVEIAIPLALLQEQVAAGDPGAVFVQLSELEHVVGLQLPRRSQSDAAPVVGEGVSIAGADAWHAAGFTGQGVKVGVLDMGFEDYEALLGSELPDSVTFNSFGQSPDPDDRLHGVACAEVIHEMAPDAELYLVSYDGSFASTGEAVEWLLDQGVQIVSHSAGSSAGPMDGSGSQAALADDVTAQGVLWVNSAGNEAQTHYRAVFTDGDDDDFHEFAPLQEMMALRRDPYAPDDEYIALVLNWDDWDVADQDYELLLIDAAGEELAASREQQAGETWDEPIEYLEYDLPIAEVVYVVILAYDAERAVTLDLFAHNAEIEFSTAEHSLTTPADARGALAVGAVNWWSDSLAEYSSQGPSNDGRLKPDISAPTGVSNVTYEGFHGTSAAAPYVAGAAALVWSAWPDLSRDELAAYLQDNALDLGASGADNAYGWGRLQLPDPAGASTPSATPTSGATPLPTSTSAPPPSPTPPGASSSSAPTWLIVVGGVAFGSGGLMLGGAFLGLVVYRQRRALPVQTPALAACPHCGHHGRAGARFCAACGQAVGVASRAGRCQSCGADLRPNARFCPLCGRAV